MSDASGILLDRASNVKIFEKLASTHLIDNRRLESVKQMNHLSDLPIGRNNRISIERDSVSDRDDDSIDEIIAEGLSRVRGSDTRSEHSERPLSRVGSDTRSPVHSRRESMRSEGDGSDGGHSGGDAHSEGGRSESMIDALRLNSRARRSPFERRSPPMTTLTAPRMSPARMMFAPAPQASPLSQHQPQDESYFSKREFERIRQSAAAPDPVLGGNYYHGGGEAPLVPTSGKNYTSMFRDLCKRRHQYISNRGTVGTSGDGEYRAYGDPDYAEKRELLIKLDEMRNLGFNIPKLDPALPIEDLQTELARRTVSMGTVETVDTVIGWICTAASILETANNMTGPFIPMENYAQNVKEGTQTPRFKYALYQLTLRFQGRSGGSPWKVVILVLLMPLIQGLLVKLIQWMAKGRINLSNNMISAGVRGLFNKVAGGGNPNSGVPGGIPGISPDMPAATSKNEPELPRVPSMGNYRPNPEFANVGAPAAKPTAAPAEAPVAFPSTNNFNPFSRYKATEEPGATNPAATTASPKPATKRPRLQRPNELISEVQSSVAGDIPSGVVTAAQRADGKIRFGGN